MFCIDDLERNHLAQGVPVAALLLVRFGPFFLSPISNPAQSFANVVKWKVTSRRIDYEHGCCGSTLDTLDIRRILDLKFHRSCMQFMCCRGTVVCCCRKLNTLDKSIGSSKFPFFGLFRRFSAPTRRTPLFTSRPLAPRRSTKTCARRGSLAAITSPWTCNSIKGEAPRGAVPLSGWEDRQQ